AVALMILPYDIMSVLFVRGEFTAEAARASAHAIAALSLGLPAFAMVKIYTSCLFALKDTKTPLRSAIYTVIINVILSITFVIIFNRQNIMPHIGIALATALAGWFNALYLGRHISRKTSFSLTGQFRQRLFKIIIATVIMATTL